MAFSLWLCSLLLELLALGFKLWGFWGFGNLEYRAVSARLGFSDFEFGAEGSRSLAFGGSGYGAFAPSFLVEFAVKSAHTHTKIHAKLWTLRNFVLDSGTMAKACTTRSISHVVPSPCKGIDLHSFSFLQTKFT